MTVFTAAAMGEKRADRLIPNMLARQRSLLGRMMGRVVTIAVFAAITTAANGQDQAAVIAKLRADLAVARETITAVRATIAELEGRVEAIAVAPPPLAQAEGRAPSHDGGSRPRDFTDVGQVDARTAMATTGVAKTSIPPTTDSPWEYGPPGPIRLPLSPPSDEYAAGVELVAGSGSGVTTFSITQCDDEPGRALPDGSTGVVNNTLTLSASAPLAKDGTTPYATMDSSPARRSRSASRSSPDGCRHRKATIAMPFWSRRARYARGPFLHMSPDA